MSCTCKQLMINYTACAVSYFKAAYENKKTKLIKTRKALLFRELHQWTSFFGEEWTRIMIEYTQLLIIISSQFFSKKDISQTVRKLSKNEHRVVDHLYTYDICRKSVREHWTNYLNCILNYLKNLVECKSSVDESRVKEECIKFGTFVDVHIMNYIPV